MEYCNIEHSNKKYTIAYKINDKIIKDKNQSIELNDGDIISLSDLLGDKIQEIKLPINKKYCKNNFINHVFHKNGVSYDIDRGFVKSLHDHYSSIYDKIISNNVDNLTLALSKNTKSGWRLVKNNQSVKSYEIKLNISLSDFDTLEPSFKKKNKINKV